MNDTATQVLFDPSRLMRYSSVTTFEVARVVRTMNSDVNDIVGERGPQRFIGSYVEVVDPATGQLSYGSTVKDWLDTHEAVEGFENLWKVTTVVDAYVLDESGVLTVNIPEGGAEVVGMAVVGYYVVSDLNGNITVWTPADFTTHFDVNSRRPVPHS